MKKLHLDDLESMGTYTVFNQGMTVIPHPKSYNYNVKVRWIAFTTDIDEHRKIRWVITHTYSPYFLSRCNNKEDKLKGQWDQTSIMAHGTTLQDLILARILIPCTMEALKQYDASFLGKDLSKYFDIPESAEFEEDEEEEEDTG